MRKVFSVRAGLMFGLALAAIMVFSGLQSADARPKYFKEFKTKYPDVKEAAKVKCNVCHMGKSKKDRNNYGKAFGKALGATKVNDVDKIKEGLTKTEKEKSAVEGKTFGDLLKDGKLPAASEE